MTKIVSLLSVVFILLVVSCSSVSNTPNNDSGTGIVTLTVYVATNGNDTNSGASVSEPVLSIQKAVSNVLALGAADVYRICVGLGVYTPGSGLNDSGPGVLITNNNIYLAGGYSSDFSTRTGKSELDGTNGLIHIINISGAANIVIDGFIVENAYYSYENGAGFLVANSTNSLIENCVISNNRATNGHGGGIYMSGQFNVVSNCMLAFNYASGRGGGMETTCNGIILDSVVSNNIGSSYGGGLSVLASYFTNDSIIIANRTTNSAYGNGGGIYMVANNCLIKGTNSFNITSSSAYGGGIYISSGQNNVIDDNAVLINNFANHGGGVYFNSANNSFFGSCINNYANYGAGIRINANGCVISNAIITNNYSTNNHGNICIGNMTSLVISGNLIGCGNISDYGIYEGNTVTNHTLVDNIFITNSMNFIYYDAETTTSITRAAWTNINDASDTGAVVASGNGVTNL